MIDTDGVERDDQGDIRFRTVSGRVVSLVRPTPEMIDIVDIAHSLAYQCRFIGHLQDHYSVAQHSVFVSHLVESREKTTLGLDQLQLAALLHDATEAYTGDLTAPMKALLRQAGSEEFERCEERLWMVIASKFRIDPDLLSLVHDADMQARATEDRDLRRLPPRDGDVAPAGETLTAWRPPFAKQQFLVRFKELTRG